MKKLSLVLIVCVSIVLSSCKAEEDLICNAPQILENGVCIIPDVVDETPIDEEEIVDAEIISNLILEGKPFLTNDLEINYDTDIMSELTKILELSNLSGLSNSSNDTYYEDYYLESIDDLSPEELETYKLYPNDIVDEAVLNNQFANTDIIFALEIEELLEIINDSSVSTIGTENFILSTSVDYQLFLLAGTGWFYIDLISTIGDKTINTIIFIEYSDTEITVEKVYKYTKDITGFSILSLVRNEDKSMDFVLYDSKFSELIVAKSNGVIIETIHTYGTEGLNYSCYDISSETYFWGQDYEEYDYRGLIMYSNNIFMMEYSLMEKEEIYVPLENYIQYNLKYVDGWDYYLNQDLYYNTQKLLLTENGLKVDITNLDGFNVPTLIYDLEEEITESNFTNPYSLTYTGISYADFSTTWNSHSDFLENNHLAAEEITVFGVSYPYTNGLIDVYTEFLSDEFLEFMTYYTTE